MLFELSVLFAFGAMLCWGIGDFFIQKVVRKIGDLEALAFIGIIGSAGLFPFVFQELPLLFSFENFSLLLVLGIVTFIVALINFEALKKGKLSVVEILLELELPITVMLAFLFFEETLSFVQFFIILLIFFGILLVATTSFSWKTFLKKFERGAFLALLTAFGMGIINFLTASSSKHISPLLAVWTPWVIFTLFSLFFILKRERIKIFVTHGKNFSYIILVMGIFDTLAWLFYAFATSSGELSITTAITESYPAIALFLGLWFNREKINWHQYVGAFLALFASFVLAFVT